jgi:prepilin-type N-terminal cleavage/methylation domain-containing protein
MRLNNKGYTLIEMVIIISIISILASTVMLNISKQRDSARDKAVMMQINNIRIAINNYRLSNDGEFPLTIEELMGKYIKKFDENWYGSKSYGRYDYNSKTGDISLKPISETFVDSSGKNYENY